METVEWYWARGISVEECAQRSGMSVEYVTQRYAKLDEELARWAERWDKEAK